MNCRRAKKLILEFVDGLPNEKLRLELETHLGQCAACEEQARSLTRSLELLRRAPVEPVDENFNWKVRLAVHKERSALQQRAASQGGLLRAWNLRYGVSAAAGVVAVVAAGWLAVQWNVAGLFEQRVETATVSPAPADRFEPSSTARNAPADNLNTPRPSSGGLGGPGLLVTLGDAPAVSSSSTIGAIDASSSVDSLIDSELRLMTPQERVLYLRELIDSLQGKLDRYGSHRR